MRQGGLSAIHFLLVVLLLFLGTVFLLQSFDWLQSPRLLLFLGAGTLCFAFLLCLFFYRIHRKTFYQLSMQKGDCVIEEQLMRDFLQEFFLRNLQDIPLQLDVRFSKRKKMEVVAYIPSSEASSFYFALQGREEALEKELQQKMGYTRRWDLTVVLV